MLCDQRVMRLYGREPLIASHHPVKFSGYTHFGSKDIIFLVVGEQDFTCLLKSTIIVIYKARDMKVHSMLGSVLITRV